MATTPNPNSPAEAGHEVLEATDSRQARWGRHAFWMLLASTVLAVVALFTAWAFYSGSFTAVNEASTPTAAEARATTGPVSDVTE